MPKFCIICKKKSITGDSSRSFHRFPSNTEMRQIWMNCFGLKSVARSACLCSDHFHVNTFITEPGERKRLKPDAVPISRNNFESVQFAYFSDNESEYNSAILLLKKTAVPSRFVWTEGKDFFSGKSEICLIESLQNLKKLKKIKNSKMNQEDAASPRDGSIANSTMSETTSEISAETEKPVQHNDEVKFPPFPDPTDYDFDDDITEEERNHYKEKFKDLNRIKTQRLHCSACDRHLGCAARNETRMRPHPMLRTLVCHTCHTFYNSGEFEKGDDGSELYCRWCGQGGQVYCCSDCPHVFCARCIKRNLGSPKIKEIEQADDWKCFKCNPKCLWDLRAICWAVLRYCDQKNKIAYNTQDPELKITYQKDCAVDYSECCKNKLKKKEKPEITKKRESESQEAKQASIAKKTTASIISKISPAIQVKKFAAINPDDRQEKKAQKRPASPSPKSKPILIKNSVGLSGSNVLNPMSLSNPQPKRMKITPPPLMNNVRFGNDQKQIPILNPRIRPKGLPILPAQYNGFTSQNPFNNIMVTNDNINLSLDNLTQGLDMTAVAAMSNTSQDDDVVCTPDLPLEPLCEVTEDNADDDVQCITPGPVAAPKVSSVPSLVPRTGNALPDLTPENIVQMTENDVTVNAVTGGLKFRVDPQTLSSNKMYRLPDGRIFAINANSAMPGGYSATIVAVTENKQGKNVPKGATYAAKLSSVSSSQASTPQSTLKTYGNKRPKRNLQKSAKVNRGTETSTRECDLNVPVEWYRYNLIDAVDALEYSLSRLHKLKKEATTMFLRTRSINEMKNLHKTLDRLLNTSVCRFNEVRENISKEIKQYVAKKMGVANNTSEDDDDVEILPESEDNDDPIFIDENSVELESNGNENQEVDLTGATSEHNNSSDKSIEINNSISNITNDSLHVNTDDLNSIRTDITIKDVNGFNEIEAGQNIEKDEKAHENGNTDTDTNCLKDQTQDKEEVKKDIEKEEALKNETNKDEKDDKQDKTDVIDKDQQDCDKNIKETETNEPAESIEKSNSHDGAIKIKTDDANVAVPDSAELVQDS